MAADDTVFEKLFGPLYTPDARDLAIFGEYYVPDAEQFEHGAWRVVARIPKAGGDGQPVEIDECRMPARFFRIRALAATDGIGQHRAAFALSTGSGDAMGRLMMELGQAIAQGMVGLASEEEPT